MFTYEGSICLQSSIVHEIFRNVKDRDKYLPDRNSTLLPPRITEILEYWGLVSKIAMHLSLIIHSVNENFIDHNFHFHFFFFCNCDPVILIISVEINYYIVRLRCIRKYKFPFLNLRIKLYLSFNSVEKYCLIFFFFGEKKLDYIFFKTIIFVVFEIGSI